MKPYSDLTRLGKLRRMQAVAENAMNCYGMPCVRPKFFYYAGNVLYKVRDRNTGFILTEDDLFEPGMYLLRIYKPGWQEAEAIELEMEWLAAMRREAGLPVPEPLPNLQGRFLTNISVAGVPETRLCVLQKWVKGRRLGGGGQPKHFREQGRLLAQMHNFTQQWRLPVNHHKRQYDWEGLFMNDAEVSLPPGESWKYLPQDWVGPFKLVSQNFKEMIAEWGMGSDVFGLIHADMGVKANLLFYHGKPRPIDFDGSGFGYWMYDLGVALTDAYGLPRYDLCRTALLQGYAEYRPVKAEYVARLDLFTAACYAYYILWVLGGTYLHPEYLTDEMEEQMVRGARFIIDYAAR